MVSIRDLHKKYKKNEVLTGIDLDIHKNGIFAILGPNGSGKTTLIKCILGMVIPDKGAIYVDENDIRNNASYRKNIDYLPQIANFPPNLRLKELIRMIKDLRPEPAEDAPLIKSFGLNESLDKRLGSLSGGTKQKVNILLTFMFDSPLIILDEPTTGLDPNAMITLKALINKEKKKGKTILLSSHIMSFVEEIADEIVFLLEGQIYFKGSVQTLRAKSGQKNLEHAIAQLLNPVEDV